MKEQLRQKLLTQLPEWHKQPLQLSIAQMDDPYSVLAYFFECYSLPDIRICLKELLNDALRAENVDAADHVSTHADIEKLVEAAWIIHEQAGNDTGTGKKYSEKSDFIEEKDLDEEIGHCYKIINGFFDAFPLPFARKYLLSALQAAESRKIWKKTAPTDLIFFFENLEALLPAVFTITKTSGRSAQVLLPIASGVPDLAQHHLYCGTYDSHKPWEYFPRSLSAKEYNDPYKALQKFTDWSGKKEWKQVFHYILSYSLGNNALSELGVNLEMVKISELLQKMLDACHLIHVRIALTANKSSKME